MFIPHPCVHAGHYSSDPKESFARGVIMVEWEYGRPLGAKLFVAERVFKCDVLRILLSEFHEGLE